MKGNIPTITYQKWWHRFIPKYRKSIWLMNKFMEKDGNRFESQMQDRFKEIIMYGKTTIGEKTFYYQDFF